MKPPPMPTPNCVVSLDESYAATALYTADQLAARDAQWAAIVAAAVAEARRDALAARDATWEAIVADAVAQERERAAKVCERRGAQFFSESPFAAECRGLAAAIRAQTDSTTGSA